MCIERTYGLMLCPFCALKGYYTLEFIISHVNAEILNAKFNVWLRPHQHTNTCHVVLLFSVPD
jgi:hypothetical protein